MRTSESIVNISLALAEMQNDKKVIGKSGNNKFDKYSYAMLEDYIRETKDVLAKHGFFIITSTGEVQRLDNRTTKAGGTEHAVQVKLIVRLIHKSGEWIEVDCLGEGQDRADKAIYKAITGARKYAIASLLGLATSDDPESDEEVGYTQQQYPAQKQVETKVADWIAKIQEQATIDGLKQAFDDALESIKDYGPSVLRQVIQAKDAQKTKLGLHAQAGVKLQ